MNTREKGKTVLLVSDGMRTNTGFSHVMKELYKMLVPHHNVIAFGIQPPNPRLKCKTYGYNVEKSVLESSKLFSKVVRRHKPDIVLTVQDMWNLLFIPDQYLSRDFSWVAYLPVDSKPFPKSINLEGKTVDIIRRCQEIDHIVAYNSFGRRAIEEAGLNVHKTILHSINLDMYKEDTEARKDVRRRLGIDDETVLYLAVGKNMVRKGFDQMLLGWARFIEEAKPRKVRLHLHTTPIGPLGWNLPRLISELGIRNYVTFTGSQQVELADDSYMNGLYNACDVLLNTSMAEGFCLPLLEACACSKPLVYTDYAGPSTVFQGCGIPIKPGSYIIWNSTESRFAVAGEKNVATAIKDMYNHIKEETKQLEEYRVAARQIAELLNTDVIAQQWLALINSIGKKGIKYIKDPL